MASTRRSGRGRSLSRHPTRKKLDGRDFYAEQINSSGKVYVFGCGHVAQELVPVLEHVGFRCVALDDRPEFANEKVMRGAEKVLLVDFENIGASVTIGPEDYICIMTRGHAYDTVVQAQALRTPACYIGVIGSKAKTAGVQRQLREQGFTDEDFKRITTPIGLDIKAETPAEIAISIAAQMIEVTGREERPLKRRLLLTGPIGCGKSTLIINTLGSAIRDAGGFLTLRVIRGRASRGL